MKRRLFVYAIAASVSLLTMLVIAAAPPSAKQRQ